MDDYSPYSMLTADERWNRDEAYSCARWRQCEPERNLLAAVLKDALLIYRRRAPNRDARFKEVERWFFSEENERLFAFKPLCAMLNVSAENIRKDLRKWTDGAAVLQPAGEIARHALRGDCPPGQSIRPTGFLIGPGPKRWTNCQTGTRLQAVRLASKFLCA